MAEQKKGQQINIELTEEMSEGVYSNLAIISHSKSEFILDFVRLVPNVKKAKVKSRVILTPDNAKRLLQALSDNIDKFEAQFGSISDSGFPPIPPMHFNTPKAEA